MAIRYYTTDSDSLIYYAATNAQGDVLGLYGGSGTLYVTYEYDSWGNLISMTDTTDIGIGSINPIRYRGYYYDAETGLYYLQSRYYDPQVGRFINADGYVSTGLGVLGNNMFAYCNNNPVNRSDPYGHFWEEVWIAFKAAVESSRAVFVTAGVISQLDTAAPGPADAAAFIIAGVTIIGCAAFAMFTTIAASPSISISIPKSSDKADDKADDATKAPPRSPSSTIIYRYGDTNPGNFVPSKRDVTTNSGLSFSTVPPRPGQKAAVTTIDALNATGIVIAYQDRPGHVRVDPVVGTLADWRKGGSTHPCTIAVKSVVVKWDGGH